MLRSIANCSSSVSGGAIPTDSSFAIILWSKNCTHETLQCFKFKYVLYALHNCNSCNVKDKGIWLYIPGVEKFSYQLHLDSIKYLNKLHYKNTQAISYLYLYKIKCIKHCRKTEYYISSRDHCLSAIYPEPRQCFIWYRGLLTYTHETIRN